MRSFLCALMSFVAVSCFAGGVNNPVTDAVTLGGSTKAEILSTASNTAETLDVASSNGIMAHVAADFSAKTAYGYGNVTLLPTNVQPWVVGSIGPFRYDCTLTKLYCHVTRGSETAMVHCLEMTTNTQTTATNNTVVGDSSGVYDLSFVDGTLNAGNTLQLALDGTGYSPLASNINVMVEYTYVTP